MSKHILFMTIGFFLLSTLTLWAQFEESRHAGLMTVSAAQEAVDDSRVALTGTILRQLGDERYLFKDATGTMIVEIDHEHWPKVPLKPETILRISGEIDRDWGTTEVEVERVEVGKASSQDFSQFQRNHSDTAKTSDGVKPSSRNLSQFQLH